MPKRERKRNNEGVEVRKVREEQRKMKEVNALRKEV